MSDDVKLFVTFTFAIIALAWVATKAGPLGTLTQSLAGAYSTGVGALKPSGA